MNAATDVSGAYMYAYLAASELVNATSLMAREATIAEDCLSRTMATPTPWEAVATGALIARRTAVSEGGSVVLVRKSAEDGAVLDEVASYGALSAGWDGEDAAKPNEASIYDAIRFVRAASGLGIEFVPTLHVDGTVILEVGDEGSIRFLGEGVLVYAFDGARPGRTEFDGFTIPFELRGMVGPMDASTVAVAA